MFSKTALNVFRFYTAGSIRLFISAADTAALDWKVGVYDLEIEFPDGRVVRRMYGGVAVSPEVTR